MTGFLQDAERGQTGGRMGHQNGARHRGATPIGQSRRADGASQPAEAEVQPARKTRDGRKGGAREESEALQEGEEGVDRAARLDPGDGD